MADNGGGQECPICLDIIDVDAYSLPCGHPYHRACIVRYFRDTEGDIKLCPLCRAPVFEDVLQPTLGFYRTWICVLFALTLITCGTIWFALT